jgi:hypothetical protein
MVGGGIASMAAVLIRDAGAPGENIHILETLYVSGGSLDGAESPVQPGYVTRGRRMLEDEAYHCLWNLLEGIPDRTTRANPRGKASSAGRSRGSSEGTVRLCRSGRIPDATVGVTVGRACRHLPLPTTVRLLQVRVEPERGWLLPPR